MTPRSLPALLFAPAVLAGCVEAGDPAEGGFVSGLSGIASGSYDARIAQSEADVAAAEARNATLARQQQDLARQIGAAEQELSREKATLANLSRSRATLDPATRAEVNEVLARQPGGATDAQRLAELQKTIADARRLSAELARL